MAAAAEIIGEPLPEHWTYGVTADGRVFYINDLHETTSWVHPMTTKPAASGLLSDPDLPSGWEWSITPEGVVYYVDHNTQRTTFIHPLTRKASIPFNDASQSIDSQRPSSLKPVPQQINKKASGRQRVINKGPEAQRMSNSKVILSGWLTVQEINSIRSWKRRWCVHADYGLFLYRDATEQQRVGSILLPSYTIRPCDASDPVSKRYAFKAEHANLRTQYFIAESKENMDEWVKVLSQSAQMLNSEPSLNSLSGPQRPASPENDNENDYYVLTRDPNQNGELRYQRTTYSKEESLPEYYPPDRQSAVSSKDYSPYSNIPSSEYSHRNSYSSNHMSPSHPGSPRLFHSQHNNSFGEAPHSRSSYSSVGFPYDQRHEYSYKSAKPPERNPGSSPGPSHHRHSVSSSLGPYPEVAPRYTYSSLDFNAMYHNGRSEDHPSSPGSYQSIGSPQSLDDTSITVPKSLEAGFYSSNHPSSQNVHSRHSLSSPHSTDFYQNHRNCSPLERSPNRDSYSSRGDHNHSQLSYEIYPRNENHSRDSPNCDLSQDSFAMNNSDIAAPYSKRLYGAQTDLSKLVVDSDHGDQKSVDMESHHEYATICRIRSESMCTSPEIVRSRPASLSVSQHGSETEIPKRTSIQQLQEMHLRELQRHSPLSKSFSSGNVPNYHNISQTLSQNTDHDEDLEVAQSCMDGGNQKDNFFKHKSTSSLPQPGYQSGNRTLSPASETQNQIVYDYQGTGHDSTLPTRSSQGLSVKPQKYPSNIDLSLNDKSHSNYVNVNNRHSYLDFVDKPDTAEFISADTSRDLHNMDYQEQSLSFDRNGQLMSNHSNLDANKPTGSDYKPMEPDPYNQSRHGSEIPDAYINYQTASNLMSANGTPPERHRHQNGIHERNINTVKEDPNMPDTAVIETTHPMFAKLKASQGRLRMSISAGDLLGKTHEELVLLLIQLRRNKAHLEHCRESLRNQIDQLRSFEQEYKRQLREANPILDFHLEDKHGHFMELKKQCGEVENKLEMYKPIENLVDNMVTMGSLYGGNNYMLATQYRKHILHPDEYIPPKKMLEFSRQHQEDVIIQKIEKDVRELTNDEADLEEKMERLCVLDRLIQEQSFNVTSLREDKETLEKTLRDIQYEQNRPSDRSQQQINHLANQQHTVDKELLKAMLQLAEASKKLEELNAESSKLEHEIALLRSKVHGELSRSQSVPSLMGDQNHTRYKMEKDLHRVKDVMDNLSKEGARLSQALHTLKLPPETSDEIAASKKQKPSTYMETDLDSKESYDLACETPPMFSPQGSSNFDYPEGQVGFVKYVRPSSSGHLQVDNNNAASGSSPVLLESHKEQPLHSQLSAQFKTGGQEVGVAVPVTSTLDGDVSYEEDNMWDISDADDNTKRFYGLLPKERPRVQTVRDVKRQAEQRRERGSNERFRGRTSEENDKEPELGDLWRTQPPNTSTADYLGGTNSPPELTPPSSYKLEKSSEPLLFPPSISQSLDYTDYNTPPLPPPLPNSMPPYSSQNHFTESNSSASMSPIPPPPTSPPPLPPLPQLQQPPTTQVPTSSTMSDPDFIRRRSSLRSLPKRLLGPKPFTPYNNTVSLLHNYEDKDLPVETVLPMKNTETKNSYSNPEISEPRVSSSVHTNNLFTAKPWATGISVPKLKRSPRGRNRYLTISSSEPIKLEHVLQRQSSINSSAGDLIPGATLINNMPDIVKSSTIDTFDEETIDRELMRPEMVLIPERYMPDSDEEDLTEEEKEKRRAKAEKIRKVLTEQSIHSWTKQMPAGHPDKIHDHIAKEKIVREHLLTLTQELAKEVTKKSKAAAVERRKTWAGTPSVDYLTAVFGEKDSYVEDILSG